MIEQPRQDHGIGDVGHLKFVKAEQPGILEQDARHLRHGVGILPDDACRLLGANVMDAPVHILHEGMKMHAAAVIRGHGHRLEEKIHQHGLAAARLAPDVKPARGLRRACARRKKP